MLIGNRLSSSLIRCCSNRLCSRVYLQVSRSRVFFHLFISPASLASFFRDRSMMAAGAAAHPFTALLLWCAEYAPVVDPIIRVYVIGRRDEREFRPISVCTARGCFLWRSSYASIYWLHWVNRPRVQFWRYTAHDEVVNGDHSVYSKKSDEATIIVYERNQKKVGL